MLRLKTTITALALLAISSLASAEEITLWVRTSSGAFLQGLADKYNASHSDKVNVTQITA
ncbi:ABC transporter substrate-binding protein, partial [Rhizobium johnstonii]